MVDPAKDPDHGEDPDQDEDQDPGLAVIRSGILHLRRVEVGKLLKLLMIRTECLLGRTLSECY